MRSTTGGRFWRVLLVIVAAAFGVRAAYVGFAKQGPCPVEVDGRLITTIESDCPAGDELYYNAAANHLADGGGFTESRIAVQGGAPPGPAADHPPLTIVVLAPVSWAGDVPPLSWLGDESHVAQHRWTMAVLGTALVALIGVLGRDAGRAMRRRHPDRTGWIAAGIAAAYPGLWVADGLIFSETVANLCLVAALLAALHARARPGAGAFALLGAASGLATLARAELALLWPFLVLPVAWAAAQRAREGRTRRTVALIAAGAVAAAGVVGPWVAYNLARFEEPVTVSTNIGLALAGSNCDPVYRGGGTGLTVLRPPCTLDPPPPGDQSQVSQVLQDRALDYMREHAGRVPAVMAARVGRSFSLFRPVDMLTYNQGEGRERWATMAGLLAFAPLVAVAVAGLVLAARLDRLTAWILANPVVIVAVASALTYGQTRFRAPAEPGLVVAAAVAAATVLEVLERRGASRSRSRAGPSRAPSVH